MHPEPTDPSASRPAPYAALALQVARRVWIAQGLHRLQRSALPLYGLLLGVLFLGAGSGASFFSGRAGGVLYAALGFVLAWIVLTALGAWRRRPDAIRALALLDARLSEEETLVSAYSFAQDAEPGPGAALHLARAAPALAGAGRLLPATLPLRLPPGLWAPPLVFLLVAAFGLPTPPLPPAAEDAPSEAGTASAPLDAEARELEQVDAGLSPEEKRTLAGLKDDLASSPQKMADAGQEKTPRAVPEELEQRAREAEALAASLAGESERVGSALLTELERHVDTAELASALRAGKLDEASKEAAQLARRLRTEDLSLEAKARIERAFAGGLEQATPADLRTLLGQHLQEAKAQLEEKNPDEAAATLERLAHGYQQSLEWKNAQETLRRLAASLRRSGQRALNGKAGRPQAGAEPLAPALGQPAAAPASGPAPASARTRTAAKAGAAPPRGSGGASGGAPASGAASTAQQGGNATTQTKSPSLGTGTGSAELGTTPTTPLAPGREERVTARVGAGAPSELSPREADARVEGSARSAQDIAVAFLKIQEEALAADPLPLSRREHVLRYFSALRKQLAGEAESDTTQAAPAAAPKSSPDTPTK